MTNSDPPEQPPPPRSEQPVSSSQPPSSQHPSSQPGPSAQDPASQDPSSQPGPSAQPGPYQPGPYQGGPYPPGPYPTGTWGGPEQPAQPARSRQSGYLMVAAVAVAALLIGFAAGYFLFHEETAESASLACSAINKVKPIDSMRDIGPFNKDPTADMLEGAWSFAKAAALEDDKYERLGTIADEMRRAMSTFKEDDLVSSIKDFKSECERL